MKKLQLNTRKLELKKSTVLELSGHKAESHAGAVTTVYTQCSYPVCVPPNTMFVGCHTGVICFP